jgi:hypothetical protein
MICPDGSAVGRVGPRCEFQACPGSTPDVPATPVTMPDSDSLVLRVGQKETVLGIEITLSSVLQDSRCPIDVQCIQAGAVKVELSLRDLASASSIKVQKMTVDSTGAPQAFVGRTIMIADVLPAPLSKNQIKMSDYRVRLGVAKEAAYKNATYLIDGRAITLNNGLSSLPESDAPGMKPTPASVTSYFGNEAMGDLNGDGLPDVAFILTQTNSGTGIFYYVVAALKTATGYKGTNAILLGDRIAPQTTEIKDGRIVVNYADRKPTEPMVAQPSVGVTKYMKVVSGALVQM